MFFKVTLARKLVNIPPVMTSYLVVRAPTKLLVKVVTTSLWVVVLAL